MLKPPSAAQLRGAIDLGAIKDAAEDPVAGVEVFGNTLYYAVMTRNGMQDLGELTPPDKHPQTGELLNLPKFHRTQVVFGGLMRLIKEERVTRICYNADSTMLSYLVPVASMLGNVPFLGVEEASLAAAFDTKNKKDLLRDIKQNNPIPGENITWPTYGSVAYALYAIRLMAAEARREAKTEVTTPAGEKTTPSGLVIR